MTRKPRPPLSAAQRKAKAKRAAAKRKARLAAVPREKIDKVALWYRQENICPYCDAPLIHPDLLWSTEFPAKAISALHHDHVFPVANGGHDTMENSQLLHPRCNLRKKRRIWPIGVAPHRDVPSARGAARTAAIKAYRASVTPVTDSVEQASVAVNETCYTSSTPENPGGTE